MRRLWLILGVILTFTLVILGIVYQVGGLKQYLQAKRSISQLKGEQGSKAQHAFEGIANAGQYRGILAYVNTGEPGGVWVWGKDGPRYFGGDQYSVYSFFTACNDAILKATPEDGAIEVKREIYTDIKKWRGRVEVGDFVAILLAGADSGGEVGILREAWVHDWWYFLPNDIGELCAR